MTFVGFAGRKVIGAFVTLFVAVTMAFFITRLAGDPTEQILGGFATADQVAAKRHELGLDRPLIEQYLSFLGDLARGDLGQSLRFNRSNTELIGSRIFASAKLTAVALVIAIVIGVPLGLFAARREGRLGDRMSSIVALLGQSVPVYWLGMMAVIVFAVNLQWLPAGQDRSLASLVLPSLVLSTIPLARVTRLTRSAMTEVLEEPFVAAARARGLSERRVLYRHGLRNAALPIITLLGLQAGMLLSGAVTVEAVFAWPGLGSLAVQAVEFRDAPLVLALVVFGALAFVAINLTVDIAYGIVDPRVRDAR
ncbi:ABC transporter permease [Desertimonas flava]|uniref:ABC transporter permease n=1 Tax=Desertimonas flava TaxID=2064846 RepID=UPI000E3457C7|nr:ABC transporter permease [Desertimonas flava]